jgi:Na+/H+ antiporter NhaD/arsenite permease-like protein
MNHSVTLDGASMGWPWAFPFIGIVLSIAVGPLIAPKHWHAHYGKIALGFAALTLAALTLFQGTPIALATFVHVIFTEYASFIILLFALYAVAGGILITGTITANPWTNTMTLALGTVAASLVGTTGAALILIRPLIRANRARAHNVHVIIFFIILVANIGGALSPLGDPPLLVGFLHGIAFPWPAQHLWLQTLIVAVPLLAIFLVLDFWHFRSKAAGRGDTPVEPLKVRGLINLALLAGIIAAALGSVAWKPGIVLDVYGSRMELQNLLRDGTLILIALLSLWLTPDEHRAANDFSWEPIREVGILFAGIFIAIAPVMAMLEAGRSGVFAFLLQAVTAHDGSPHEAAYFWLTGSLSAFLDNAPTYLAFFELAGGDAKTMMGPLAGTLASISMGAVYMGGLTYIGNAPNLMTQSIAREAGINMPNFFGYMLWAAAVMVPLFVLLTLLPISPLLNLP